MQIVGLKGCKMFSLRPRTVLLWCTGIDTLVQGEEKLDCQQPSYCWVEAYNFHYESYFSHSAASMAFRLCYSSPKRSGNRFCGCTSEFSALPLLHLHSHYEMPHHSRYSKSYWSWGITQIPHQTIPPHMQMRYTNSPRNDWQIIQEGDWQRSWRKIAFLSMPALINIYKYPSPDFPELRQSYRANGHIQFCIKVIRLRF